MKKEIPENESGAAVPDFVMPQIIAVQHRTAAPLWAAIGHDGAAAEVEVGDIPSLADRPAGTAIRREPASKALVRPAPISLSA